MTGNDDQDALNKLVRDYGWKWGLDDWADYKGGPVLYRHIHSEMLGPDIAPYAGTWVEGKLRELMGEAFESLSFSSPRNQWEVWIETAHDHTCYHGDTIIQALVAALREVLKQKEVSGGNN